MLDTLLDQPFLGFLGGLAAFSIGGAIVAVHNDWSTLLSGFVSLVGWIALAEGVLMIALGRRFLEPFARIPLTPAVTSAFGGGTAVLGAVLLWMALVG